LTHHHPAHAKYLCYSLKVNPHCS